eukprot:jgi/Chlat1/9117/Chrsp97S00708
MPPAAAYAPPVPAPYAPPAPAPSPYGMAPGYAPPAAPYAGTVRRKALLVGINYRGTQQALQGCINDTKCMRYLLITKFGFREQDILMMNDDEPNPLQLPTKFNILQGMRWLTESCMAGDSLFFQFSGHGSQVADHTGDEADGYNETLVPLDFRMAGMIVDDTVNDFLVKPLVLNARLHCVVDACHSGTALDLPYVSLGRDKYGRNAWEDHSTPGIHKGTRGGEAYCFSGCRDDQTSADTSVLSGTNVATGAMSYCFIEAIERGQGQSYLLLLDAMQSALQNGRQRFTQIPQLSSTTPFDLNRRFYL